MKGFGEFGGFRYCQRPLWMFVFNDGALCWGFPHFLPLMVLIPRGAVCVWGGGGFGTIGPDWVRTGWAATQYQLELHMISLNSSRMSLDWKQGRAHCVALIKGGAAQSDPSVSWRLNTLLCYGRHAFHCSFLLSRARSFTSLVLDGGISERILFFAL